MFKALLICTTMLAVLVPAPAASSDINCDEGRIYHKDLSQSELDFLLLILPSFDKRPAAITAVEVDGLPMYQVVTTCDEGHDWVSGVQMSSSEYQDFFDDNVALGYRPQIVELYGTFPDEKYLSVMIDDGIQARGRHRTSTDEWLDQRQELLDLGYLPAWFSSCGSGSSTRYASVWVMNDSDAGMRTFTEKTLASFTEDEQEERYDGSRLISASVHGSSANPYIGGFFTRTLQPQWSVDIDLTSLELNALVDEKEDAGWEPYVITAYMNGSFVRYLAVFQRDPARTFRITGTEDPGFEALDAVMETHMKTYCISRGQLAVTDAEGRLVLARGYTWDAPDVTSTNETDLFRIASVSKPITAVAIMALFEDGLMGEQDLDDPVADLLDDWDWCELDCPSCFDSFCPDPFWPDMSCRHLLTHYSGIVRWSNGDSGDVMAANRTIRNYLNSIPGHDTVSLPVSIDEIHEFMRLQGLDEVPGTSHKYSNYGYSLLGRIIEAASGMDYEDYVQERVFDPLCITRIQIGSTLGDADNEVDYHDSMYQYRLSVLDDDDEDWVPRCYGGNNITNFDSHGGWIASAVDLAAFVSAFSDPAGSPLLTEESINEMFSAPYYAPKSSYAHGWRTNSSLGPYHSGSLAGTTAAIHCLDDGTTLSVLLNRRVNDAVGYSSSDDNIRSALASTWTSITWSDVDYWNDYFCTVIAPADINQDGAVNILDLLVVLDQWGFCGLFCPADINNDGVVDVLDLLAVISGWST